MHAQTAALALGLLLMAGSGSQGAETAAPVPASVPQPPSISVVAAVSREVVASIVVTGTLVPRETVAVGSDVDGLRIEDLLADEGDVVEAGAVLAKLSTDMIDVEMARNESQVARADAAIAQSSSQIDEAESASVEAESALARTRPLNDKGIVGQDVLDQRISTAASARARLAAARHGLSVAEADKALIVAEGRELVLRKAKAEIKAPTAGLVLERSARRGAIASTTGGALFEIIRDGLIELDAEVSETVLNTLAVGQKAKVVLIGRGEPIEGEIRLVSPKVDQATRLGRIRIALPPSRLLYAGAFARGIVETARSHGVVVPQTAVVIDAQKAVVQIVRDGMIETRIVKLGISSGADVEVREGLHEGDQVVALAGTFVREGDAVTPVALSREIRG